VVSIFDTHTHLDSQEFDGDREAVIERAYAAGVHYIVNVGAVNGFQSARRSIDLAEKYSFIWASVGLHPNDAALPLQVQQLKELALHPRVVAIGETGLDFYRDWSPPERQEQWFRAHIELALEIKKPLIIHSRAAAHDCLRILKEHGAHEVGGVFHCFSENSPFAEALKGINFLFSVPGVVTFKNAVSLHEAVRTAPAGSFMLETDSPYLAPHPHRGKRCESGFITLTAQKVAELRDVPYEQLCAETTETALNFFGLKAARTTA
jgi:TatD DNase family protein